MIINSLKLVYFSPTGTTRAVILSIASAINHSNTELIDITNPSNRLRKLSAKNNDLIIVGIPVYSGRIPTIAENWLNTIQASNTPAVCVAVYGNRAYDNALLELGDILKAKGCRPIAAAAFIGEHSFSNPETPIALSRPDTNDLNSAKLFGSKIVAKLLSANAPEQIPTIDLPGSYPYGGNPKPWGIDFIRVTSNCIQCGICAEVCPTNAIDPSNCQLTNKDMCIACCACIKKCPQNARVIVDSPVKEAAIRLNKLYKERKEPEFYI